MPVLSITPQTFVRARELADKLVATNEPSKYWDDLESMTAAEARALDTIAFECAACNQWYAVSEREENDRGEWICRQCL